MHSALELFRARQYPDVVAVCTEALGSRPTDVQLRIVLARALLALRRDVDAQHELRHCLRFEPGCGVAYRLLGEMSLRREEYESAKMFLREALRYDQRDVGARELLDVVTSLNQPTAAVEKLPAATAAAGCPTSLEARRPTGRPSRLGAGTNTDHGSTRVEQPREREHSGFGKYLVRVGMLTATQLSAVLAYHHSKGVRVGEAAVALGFISGPKVEWAALAYHSARREEKAS